MILSLHIQLGLKEKLLYISISFINVVGSYRELNFFFKRQSGLVDASFAVLGFFKSKSFFTKFVNLHPREIPTDLMMTKTQGLALKPALLQSIFNW